MRGVSLSSCTLQSGIALGFDFRKGSTVDETATIPERCRSLFGLFLMGRIRTIKPDFAQSESIGRLSRDARFLFVLLWTLADDSGRLRGTSAYLSSMCFPYDGVGLTEIDAWVLELESEGCAYRYQVNNGTYIQITNWLKHQRIDKPSRSTIPEPSENPPRAFVESSENVLGGTGLDSRKGEGPMKEDSTSPPPSIPIHPQIPRLSAEDIEDVKDKRAAKYAPTWDQLVLHCEAKGIPLSVYEKFYKHYMKTGWRVGNTVMRNWVYGLSSWIDKEKEFAKGKQ